MFNINQTPIDENGLRHGEWVEYHDNGLLFYRSNYVHGVPHGLDEAYDYDGSLWYRGYRNMGIKVGYWYDGRSIGQWDWYNEKLYYLWLI